MLKTKNKTKGIRHIIDGNGLKMTHLQKLLTENNIPGKWDSHKNVTNLINGYVKPVDPYVYIFLSEYLNIRLEEVIHYYSEVQQEYKEIKLNEKDLF